MANLNFKFAFARVFYAFARVFYQRGDGVSCRCLQAR